MRWREKVEIGLKVDAPFRKDKPFRTDNVPPSQIRGPEPPTGPGRSPEVPMSCSDHASPPDAPVLRTDDLPPQD